MHSRAIQSKQAHNIVILRKLGKVVTFICTHSCAHSRNAWAENRLDTRHQTSPRRHIRVLYWLRGPSPCEGCKNSVSLKKLAFQPCSTPAKAVSFEAFSLLMINQKSAFHANQGFTGLFSLSGFDIGISCSWLNLRSKRVHRWSANLCRNANFSHVHMTFHDACPTSSGWKTLQMHCFPIQTYGRHLI